jgi:chromosome segregation ATPase
MSPIARSALVAGTLLLGPAGAAIAEEPAAPPPPAPPATSDSQRFADWAKAEIDRLNQQVELLKAQIAELNRNNIAPALDSAREGLDRAQSKLEADRPELEASGARLWEKMKSTAATVGEELRQTWDKVEEKLSDRR